MEKILVTGATGRIGANLVKKLTDMDYKVKVFVLHRDPKIDKLKNFCIEIIYGDLIDRKVLGERRLHGCPFKER